VVAPSFVFGKLLRRMHSLRQAYPIPDELRGWSWDKPPVKPRAYLSLGIYEVASYCPTRRDVWLKRFCGATPTEIPAMKLGLDVHEVISSVISSVRRYVVLNDIEVIDPSIVDEVLRKYEEREWFKMLRHLAMITYHVLVSDYLWFKHGNGGQPFLGWLSEVRVDGSPIGLSSNLRVDAIVSGNLIIDFKVGRRYENHELALAGYALAIEANTEVPIDYGFLIYIIPNGNIRIDVKPVYVGPDIRRDFIDARDEVIDMILSEKEPPKSPTCPYTCPFKHACTGGKA